MLLLPPSILDTDTLSEFIKGRNQLVVQRGRLYLRQHGRFTFSIITRYEILKGLKAKNATAQIVAFERRCHRSIVLPLTDAIVVGAAEIYADLYRRGQLILDADIFIAATAMEHGLVLVTNNLAHFQRISNLQVTSWASS